MCEGFEEAGPKVRMSEFYRAAKAGQEAVVMGFLRKGVPVDSRNGHYRSALHLAAWQGHDALVKSLMGKGAVVNAVDKKGFTAVDLAEQTGHSSTVALLKEQGGGNGKACSLHGAILQQDLRAVKALLARGANLNEADYGRLPINLALEGRSETILRAVLEAEPNIRLADQEKCPPLIPAAAGGWRLAVLEKLVAGGADVNATGRWGWTPLIAAASAGNREAVRFLISGGADLNASLKSGETALAAALRGERTDVGRELLRAGAKHDLSDLAVVGEISRIEVEVREGADVNRVGVRGNTALYEAASGNHADLVALLLRNGADPNVPGRDGEVPLYAACREANVEVMKLLLDAGAEPNACGSRGPLGATPLHHLGYAGSSHQGRPNVAAAVRLMIERGADPSTTDEKGRNVAATMIFWGRKDLARLVESYLAQSPAASLENLLKPEVVAERLSVGLDFVLDLIRSGRLEALELGKDTLRVPEAALKRYVQTLRRVARG